VNRAGHCPLKRWRNMSSTNNSPRASSILKAMAIVMIPPAVTGIALMFLAVTAVRGPVVPVVPAIAAILLSIFGLVFTFIAPAGMRDMFIGEENDGLLVRYLEERADAKERMLEESRRLDLERSPSNWRG
jgi:hypothetical protein